jgi:hypothetical protein
VQITGMTVPDLASGRHRDTGIAALRRIGARGESGSS